MTGQTPELSKLMVAGFLDAAAGKNARTGDYAAIATVGLDPAGYFYCLDLWMQRAAPSRQAQAVFDLHERWQYQLFGLETNCFQQLLLLPLEEERKRRRDAGRPWRLGLQEVHHHQNKEMRIATLEPLIHNGWLRFSRQLPDAFWAQMEQFPQGEHDDGLDALEGAVALLKGLQGRHRRGEQRHSARPLKNF